MTDDIEIEDAQEGESNDKNKAQQFTAFSKQKLGKGLQALKGQSCMYTVFCCSRCIAILPLLLASESRKNY